MVILVAALLSTAAMLLKPAQDRNLEIEKMKSILASANIEVTTDNAIDLYKKYITKEIVLNPEGKQLDLYENGIKELAQTKGRDNYHKVAKLLKKLKQIQGGDKKVISIVIFFRAKYKIRRAMMEIMNKNFPETVLSVKNSIEQNRML